MNLIFQMWAIICFMWHVCIQFLYFIPEKMSICNISMILMEVCIYVYFSWCFVLIFLWSSFELLHAKTGFMIFVTTLSHSIILNSDPMRWVNRLLYYNDNQAIAHMQTEAKVTSVQTIWRRQKVVQFLKEFQLLAYRQKWLN